MKNFKQLMVTIGTLAVGLLSAAPLWAAEQESGDSASTNPLTADPDLAIFTAVVFLLLLAFLSKFAWRPLMDGLDKREKSIRDMIEDAERSNAAAAERMSEYEQKLRSAAEEAQEIVAEARRDAKVTGEKLVEEAREVAERERQRALSDIESAKHAAVKEIAGQGADLAFTLAGKLIHRELRPDDHATLIRESLDKFPSEN